MPGVTLPNDAMQTMSQSIARIEQKERQTRSPDATSLLVPPLVFTFPGDLVASVTSPPFYPELNVWLLRVRVSLTVAATSDHVIGLNVDGVQLQTFTLPSGDATMTESIGIRLTTANALTLTTVTVTDANLSVIFEQRPA